MGWAFNIFLSQTSSREKIVTYRVLRMTRLPQNYSLSSSVDAEFRYKIACLRGLRFDVFGLPDCPRFAPRTGIVNTNQHNFTKRPANVV